MADDGASGELDNVARTIEMLPGGSAADRLTATGPLAATVIAGAGNDDITIRDGDADSAECGDGNDTVLADPVDSLNAACETVRLCSRTHSSAHSSQPGTRDVLGALGAPLAGHRFATTTATHTDA